MKTKELLKLIVNNDICIETMGIIEVNEHFDFVRYFGFDPATVKVPEGEYLYIYTDCVSDSVLQLFCEFSNDCLVTITTDDEDKRNGGLTKIYLIKLDD